jgi:hypothetical protein
MTGRRHGWVIMSRETAAEAAVGPQLAQQALEELPLLLHQVWLVSLAGRSRDAEAEAAVGPQLAQQALQELPLPLHQVWPVSLAGRSRDAAAEAAVGPQLAQQALEELPLLLHQVQTFLMWLLCPLRGVLNLNLHGPTAWL